MKVRRKRTILRFTTQKSAEILAKAENLIRKRRAAVLVSSGAVKIASGKTLSKDIGVMISSIYNYI